MSKEEGTEGSGMIYFSVLPIVFREIQIKNNFFGY